MVKQRSESIGEFNCRRICGDREANSGKRKKAKLDNKPDTLLIVLALWDMAGFEEFVNQGEKLSSGIDARQRSSLESCNIDPRKYSVHSLRTVSRRLAFIVISPYNIFHNQLE